MNTDAITFDEFLSGEFSAKFFNGSWWSDTELQWKDQVSLSYKFFKNAAPIKKTFSGKGNLKGIRCKVRNEEMREDLVI